MVVITRPQQPIPIGLSAQSSPSIPTVAPPPSEPEARRPDWEIRDVGLIRGLQTVTIQNTITGEKRDIGPQDTSGYGISLTPYQRALLGYWQLSAEATGGIAMPQSPEAVRTTAPTPAPSTSVTAAAQQNVSGVTWTSPYTYTQGGRGYFTFTPYTIPSWFPGIFGQGGSSYNPPVVSTGRTQLTDLGFSSTGQYTGQGLSGFTIGQNQVSVQSTGGISQSVLQQAIENPGVSVGGVIAIPSSQAQSSGMPWGYVPVASVLGQPISGTAYSAGSRETTYSPTEITETFKLSSRDLPTFRSLLSQYRGAGYTEVSESLGETPTATFKLRPPTGQLFDVGVGSSMGSLMVTPSTRSSTYLIGAPIESISGNLQAFTNLRAEKGNIVIQPLITPGSAEYKTFSTMQNLPASTRALLKISTPIESRAIATMKVRPQSVAEAVTSRQFVATALEGKPLQAAAALTISSPQVVIPSMFAGGEILGAVNLAAPTAGKAIGYGLGALYATTRVPQIIETGTRDVREAAGMALSDVVMFGVGAAGAKSITTAERPITRIVMKPENIGTIPGERQALSIVEVKGKVLGLEKGRTIDIRGGGPEVSTAAKEGAKSMLGEIESNTKGNMLFKSVEVIKEPLLSRIAREPIIKVTEMESPTLSNTIAAKSGLSETFAKVGSKYWHFLTGAKDVASVQFKEAGIGFSPEIMGSPLKMEFKPGEVTRSIFQSVGKEIGGTKRVAVRGTARKYSLGKVVTKEGEGEVGRIFNPPEIKPGEEKIIKKPFEYLREVKTAPNKPSLLTIERPKPKTVQAIMEQPKPKEGVASTLAKIAGKEFTEERQIARSKGALRTAEVQSLGMERILENRERVMQLQRPVLMERTVSAIRARETVPLAERARLEERTTQLERTAQLERLEFGFQRPEFAFSEMASPPIAPTPVPVIVRGLGGGGGELKGKPTSKRGLRSITKLWKVATTREVQGAFFGTKGKLSKLMKGKKGGKR